jgi:hypothetical protein
MESNADATVLLMITLIHLHGLTLQVFVSIQLIGCRFRNHLKEKIKLLTVVAFSGPKRSGKNTAAQAFKDFLEHNFSGDKMCSFELAFGDELRTHGIASSENGEFS